MSLLDRVLGRPLSTDEAEEQQIGPAAGIPVLGLDALSSAAYGPEAALTLLLPLGAAGLHFVAPIIGLIVAILLIVTSLTGKQSRLIRHLPRSMRSRNRSDPRP